MPATTTVLQNAALVTTRKLASGFEIVKPHPVKLPRVPWIDPFAGESVSSGAARARSGTNMAAKSRNRCRFFKVSHLLLKLVIQGFGTRHRSAIGRITESYGEAVRRGAASEIDGHITRS